MNGRVYDYNVGRFMSVDPIIQSPGNSQSINPYSYIMNNPLSGTDPTGYSAEKEIPYQSKRGQPVTTCLLAAGCDGPAKTQAFIGMAQNALGVGPILDKIAANIAGFQNGARFAQSVEPSSVGGSVTITDLESEEVKVSEGVLSAIYGQDSLSAELSDLTWNSSDEDSFGADDAASLAVGFTPAGVAADIYTAIAGEDFFTGEEVSGIWRYAGIIPFVSEARKGYKGVQEASELLKSNNVPREYRKQILESFEIDTIQIRMAGKKEFGIRYFDNVDAFADGRYLFETFPATRQSLALPPDWNQMTGIKQWQIKPGTMFIQGRASAQGAQYPGGQMQKFILDPSKDLIK